jgi:hypothetical protein
MNRNQAIKEIRSNLKKLLSFTSDEKVFNNMTLTDGTVITISTADLEIGAEVYMLDDQGNQTPLDNGDYVLQDGRTFSVEDNQITVIEGPESDGTDVETGDGETDSVETSKQEMDANGLPEGQGEAASGGDVDPQADLAQRVADLEKTIAEVLNILNKMGDSQNDLNQQMMSKISEVAGEPGDKPVKSIKRGYEVYNKDKATSKRKVDNSVEMIEFMKQIKTKNNY